MSKVAAYLRGHLSGEVSTRADVREAMSTDGGVMKIVPELVIYPRTTNDVRKVARFSWQLAQKGHVLPITVRGAGTDSSGASIGNGVSLVTTAHLNKIFEYDAKQKLVRLQPGASIGALNQALTLHGSAIMTLAGSPDYATVGGAIADAASGPYAGKYGAIDTTIDQLEVVLANGDVLQTGRISKKELSRRKGVEGMEGDIYRGIDSIIEDNAELLDNLRANDAVGYNTIADVKQRDGSFDLTPLFVGSQGTLGIITEMIMRAEYRGLHLSVGALVFSDANAARDSLDFLSELSPAFLEYIDATLFETASSIGKLYDFYTNASGQLTPKVVVLVGFDDFNDRQRDKHYKQLRKYFEKQELVHVSFARGDEAEELISALDVAYYSSYPDKETHMAPPVLSGFHVPTARLEDFMNALDELATKHHTELPLLGHVVTNIYTVYPPVELKKVADKQKIFKLLDDVTKLVYAHGGTMVAEGGEGRLKSKFIYSHLEEPLIAMYDAIRAVFDPLGTLNPGVKQSNEMRVMIDQLRDEPAVGHLARFGLYS
jgi:FAD/FMN-containing dehydrogenase